MRICKPPKLADVGAYVYIDIDIYILYAYMYIFQSTLLPVHRCIWMLTYIFTLCIYVHIAELAAAGSQGTSVAKSDKSQNGQNQKTAGATKEQAMQVCINVLM